MNGLQAWERRWKNVKVTTAIKSITTALMFCSIMVGLLMSAEYGAPLKLVLGYLILGDLSLLAFVGADIWENRR